MAFYTDWAEKLQASRDALYNNVQINDPENYQKPTGVLDFLKSPVLNPQRIQATMLANSGNSTYRDVQIRYQAHWGEEDLVTTDASLICDATNQRRDSLVTVTPTLFTSYKFTLEEDYVRQNTESWDTAESRLTRSIRSAQRVARENMSTQIMAKLASLVGANPAQGVGAGSYTSFQAINSSGGVDVNNFDIMHNDQEDNFMSGPIGVIGFGGNVRKYFNRLATGNLNTNAGVDIASVAQQFGALMFKEHSTQAALGSTNKLLAIYPGLTQFFNYNTNNGYFMKETPDSLIKGTIPDALYNFDWDYDLFYDRQCTTGNGIQGAWTFRIWNYFDIFNVPEAAYGDVYSDMNDFNGIVGYQMTSL